MISKLKRSVWAGITTMAMIAFVVSVVTVLPAAAADEIEDPQTPVASVDVAIIPATCEHGDILVYSNLVNAVVVEGSTPSGTEGPIQFRVQFNATNGAEFTNSQAEDKTVHFNIGELSGPLVGDECNEVVGGGASTGGADTDDPANGDETPPQLPDTASESAMVFAVSVGLVALLGGIIIARRVSSPSL